MTREETAQAIADAEKAGFDLSLVESNLALSPEQRLLRHDSALEFAQALRAAGKRLNVQTPSTAASAR